MFTVYGVSGREFSGTLEELRRVAPLRAVPRAQPELRQATRDSTESTFGTLGDEANRAYTQTQQSEPARHPLTRVSELMSRRVFTLPDTATVMQGWRLLAQEGIGQVPIVDAGGLLVGLLLRADLLPAPDTDARGWGALLNRPVTALMVTPVPGVAPDTDIRRVAQVLLDAALPGLPVTDDHGAVQGFISRADILRAVVHEPPLDLWS